MSSTGTPDLSAIADPRLWRLALQIDSEALRAVLWSTVEDASLIRFTLPLDPTLPPAAALEEAVYAAPVLLADFAAVDVVLRTRACLLAPSQLPDDCVRRMMKYACVASDSDVIRSSAASRGDAAVHMAVDADVARFLARTFRNPRVHCHAAVLDRYFGSKSALGNSGKVYVHFHQGASSREADILCYAAGGRLAIVTTHRCDTDDDAVYYIAATAREAGLDLASDEILLCGNQQLRDSVMPKLRRYASYVMPLIFPSAAFRVGRDALNAPFPLIILPLCV